MIRDNRILMVQQEYKGETIWTLPGGSIEEGETPSEAAVREVREETGLRIEIVRLLLEMYSEKINGMYYCFLGEVIEGTARLGRDPELDEHSQQLKQLKWTDLSELTEHVEIKRIVAFIDQV